MVIAYHVIFGAHGFWLPNDPRGSWSDFVGSWELYRYGPATKVDEVRSVAYEEHDQERRLAAKTALKYPPVLFDGLQTRAVARGFADYAQRKGLAVHACAILPDHVHLVLARGDLPVERVVVQLKGAATERLLEEGIHPFGHVTDTKRRHPKAFARGEWKVFLDSAEIVPHVIRYVEDNPSKEGKPKQVWRFVTPFTGVV